MKRTGRYLNENERYVIEVELSDRGSISGIARKLGRARCTIQREIARGSCEQIDWRTGRHVMVYKADYAQMRARQRSSLKGRPLKIGHDMDTARVLEGLITANGWSPAAALAHAEKRGLCRTRLSVTTLYAYVKGGVLAITEKDLPRRGAQRRRQQEQYRHAHRNVRGASIEQRPEEAASREQFGHWEGDLIVGKSRTKACYLTLVERKTRYVVTMRLPDRRAAGVVRCIDVLEKRFGRIFSQVFRSVTFDNGSEFADFEGMERSRWASRRGDGPRTRVYYAHPYRSCERGSNENCNGLLRRAGFKKGSNLGLIRAADAKAFTAWVNDLPRKVLGYATAAEAFEREVALIKGGAGRRTAAS